ncbi:hypothetical protein [Methylomonas koyamae]|uniref:hypothetical protein n=1 Tax=Methylomonas koyamae TaxID=702114 RepID=UPI00211085F3|nr:hypothetical protein [Methylomonas koyamae]
MVHDIEAAGQPDYGQSASHRRGNLAGGKHAFVVVKKIAGFFRNLLPILVDLQPPIRLRRLLTGVVFF